MRDVLEVIKSRRSVRKYKPDQISKDQLDKIIEAGIYAPSAHNQQPWHFTVIQNTEVLEKINSFVREEMIKSSDEWINRMGSKPEFKVTYDAPTLIIVSGKKDGMAWRTDCAAAIENMLIAAESMDIGSVWLGLMRFLFADKEQMSKLNIPEDYEPYYGVSFGYKDYDASLPAPRRKVDVVNYIL